VVKAVLELYQPIQQQLVVVVLLAHQALQTQVLALTQPITT
jgi:hypothetical protein